MPADPSSMQGRQSQTRGSPFALVNGATAPEPLCISVAEGVLAPQAIHLLYISSGASVTLLDVYGQQLCTHILPQD